MLLSTVFRREILKILKIRIKIFKMEHFIGYGRKNFFKMSQKRRYVSWTQKYVDIHYTDRQKRSLIRLGATHNKLDISCTKIV